MLFGVRKMPHQDISLDKVLSGSGQDCVDLSPIENYIFWMGPKLYRVTIFFGSDVLRPKLYRVTIFVSSDVFGLATEAYMLFACARCLTTTLGSIAFFLTQVKTGRFEPRGKL